MDRVSAAFNELVDGRACGGFELQHTHVHLVISASVPMKARAPELLGLLDFITVSGSSDVGRNKRARKLASFERPLRRERISLMACSINSV